MKGRIIKQRGMINHMKQALLKYWIYLIVTKNGSLNSKMLRETDRQTDKQTDRDRQTDREVIMIIRQKVKVNHLKLVGP